MFKYVLLALLVLSIGTNIFLLLRKPIPSISLSTPVATPIPAKPLLAYTFEALKQTMLPKSRISLGNIVHETAKTRTQMFYFWVPKNPTSTELVRVSGLLNMPKSPGNYPIIMMLRGFVPTNLYHPGVGTQPAANAFAADGFITLAPDFLGFGESDGLSGDSFTDRFQTYVTALTLLTSLPNLNPSLIASYSGIQANTTKVGIWGHSNGGHIALATLEISGGTYPTVLWAPVSQSFPYSILAYTNEADDQGKSLRRSLSSFETLYNTDDFSPTQYFNWINAPLQIHQGTNDHEVPVWWSDGLVSTLKKQGTSVEYVTHKGADHNLLPSGWTDAVKQSMVFYQSSFSRASEH